MKRISKWLEAVKNLKIKRTILLETKVHNGKQCLRKIKKKRKKRREEEKEEKEEA